MTIHEEIEVLKAQLEALEQRVQEEEQKKYPKKYEGYGELVESWEELDHMEGWFTSNNNCQIYSQYILAVPQAKSTFATENQARSALAMAQLSQLMMRAWGEWRPDWSNTSQMKACIKPSVVGGMFIEEVWREVHFLAFPTFGMAYGFFETHKELIEEYSLQFQYE